jgi:hypothetical protein
LKVLIIGFGSIGKRHYDVLSQLSEVQNIDLVTKQNIENIVCYINLEIIKNIEEYDYFVIASETNKHFEQLKFLEENVKNKLIFCEKPLFESKQDIEIKNNIVFVGYVLRFHPLLEKLKEMIKKEKIILVNAKCGQYLPSWRLNIDYKESYSAKKEEGGGVLLIGKTNQDIFVNISIDYISKITNRRLLVETLEYTYELDFIENKLVKKDKAGFEEIFSSLNLKRNYMFEQMHLDIFNQQKNICTFKEALEVMQTISTIQEQNR